MRSQICLLTMCCFFFIGASHPRNQRDLMFQESIIESLLRGNYHGVLTIGELKKKGDFGLGTFDSLDGEMVVLDGDVYKIKDTGVPILVNDDESTPFASVTFFETDRRIDLGAGIGCKEIEVKLKSLFPSENIFYAIKIEGDFDRLRMRSVPKQTEPFVPLVDVLDKQTVFNHNDLSGTMVGFWVPDYMREINVAGFHFHFISKDRKVGGHVLDCTIKNVRVDIDDGNGFEVSLPDDESFLKIILSGRDSKSDYKQFLNKEN